MKQLFAKFAIDDKLYPVIECYWNTFNGILRTVTCTTPYDSDIPDMFFVFNVVNITQDKIELELITNKNFKAEIQV